MRTVARMLLPSTRAATTAARFSAFRMFAILTIMLDRTGFVNTPGAYYPSGWLVRPYNFWPKEGSAVPRIPDQIRECVFYVYPDQATALAGERAGGSGFFVGRQSQVFEERYYVYAVTNRHVIARCGPSPVLTLHTDRGGLGFVATPSDKWVFHGDCDDLAALPVLLPPQFRHKFIAEEKLFLTKELMEKHDIGPGDDVFLLGRYVNHEGRQQNWPSLRFGHISMMNWEPITQEGSGLAQESFVIECRSIGGYSGSPVFVWSPPGSSRPQSDSIEMRQLGPWLLGVDWGHLRMTESVADAGGKPHPDGWRVATNSGMAGVVPVWKLVELLDQPELKEGRDREEARLRTEQESAASLDTLK